MPRPRFLSIEQKVQSLSTRTGEVRDLLLTFWKITTEASLDEALGTARKIAEYVVGSVLRTEGLESRRELLADIETLGGRDAAAVKQRGRAEPVLPPPVYSALHGVRIYGNHVVHPYDRAGHRKVRVSAIDLQAALALLLRVVEWYFLEYPNCPPPPVDPLYVDAGPPGAVGEFSDAPPDAGHLVGREEELAALGRLLDDAGVRCVSLLAPGGTGKSCLAARAVHDFLAARAADPPTLLWFDLSGAPPASEVTARVLASLHPGWSPTDTEVRAMSPPSRASLLVRRLAERPALLVLDNLESWLDARTGEPSDEGAVHLFRQLATAAHQGRVVLTTRRAADLPFRVSARVELRLGGLSEAAYARLARSEGLSGEPAALGRVWRSLGGNPRLLGFLADLVRRRYGGDLDRALAARADLLEQTSDRLLQEVWDELPPGAAATLQALALLTPPVRPDDLRRACAALFPDDPPAADDLAWDQLVPRDLVRFDEAAGGFRFEHPLIADHARDHWGDPGPAHRQLAAFFLARVEEEVPAVAGDSAYDALWDVTPLSEAGLNAALSAFWHAVAGGDGAAAGRLLFRLPVVGRLWTRGDVALVAELCQAWLRVFGPAAPEMEAAHARAWRGTALRSLGQREEAAALSEASLAEFRRGGDEYAVCRELISLSKGYRPLLRNGEARAAVTEALALCEKLGLALERAAALTELAELERSVGRGREAAQRAREALAAADALGYPGPIGDALNQFGAITRASNPARAGAYFRRSLACARLEGARRKEAWLLSELADVARREGSVEEALGLATDALERSRQLGNRTGEAQALRNRGLAHLARGAAPEALEDLRAALAIVVALGHWRTVVGYLEDLGPAFEIAGEFAVAAACYQTADEFHVSHGMHVERYRRRLDGLRKKAEATGVGGWEEAARTRRPELLAAASGTDAERWRVVLAEMIDRDSPPEGR